MKECLIDLFCWFHQDSESKTECTHNIVEHGVDEHREVDQRHHTRQPLHPGETGPDRPPEDAEPEVVVL